MGDYLVSDCCNHRICCFESKDNRRGYVWSCASERIKAGTERELRIALEYMFNEDGTRFGRREPRHLAYIGFEVMYNPMEDGYFIRHTEGRKGLRLERAPKLAPKRVGPDLIMPEQFKDYIEREEIQAKLYVDGERLEYPEPLWTKYVGRA